MVDKIKACFERVKVIKGVGKGSVTKEQIQILMLNYRFNANEEKEFYRLLDEQNIRLVEEDDIQPNNEPVIVDYIEESRKKVTEEEWERRFEGQLQICQMRMREMPQLYEQYHMEKTILMNAIREGAVDSNRRIVTIVCDAVIEISHLRIKNVRKGGWVCGTHVNRIRERFEQWVSYNLSAAELKELINYCVIGMTGSKSEEHWNQVLTVLLFNAPRIIVNPGYKLD